MDDGTTKANPWQAVCEAMVTHVLRALQVIYDDFNVSLERWLNDMVSHPIAEDWRGEVAAFVDETERKGLRILPGSIRVIESLIESRIACTGQFARFGPAQRTRARAKPIAPSASTATVKVAEPLVKADPQARPVGYPDIPTGHRGPAVNAERLFDQQLASAKRHFNVLDQLLKVAGEKLDAAKPDEEVDIEYEAETVKQHLFLYNEDLIVARDLWLRFNLSSDANSRLIEMPTPVGLGLPMYSSPAQAERARQQRIAISRRLNQQNATMDAWVTGIALADLAVTAAGVVASAGVLVAAAKKGGTWVVIKTVAAGAAMSYANKKAEGALRDQGVSEQTINGVRLAAAVITLILMHKVAKRAAPPPKGRQRESTPNTSFGAKTVGAAQRKFEQIVEDEVIDALRKRRPTAESLELKALGNPHKVATLDPNLGPNQVRYQVQFFDHVNGELVDISINYDPDTGLFGTIKEASGNNALRFRSSQTGAAIKRGQQ